jgi:hypothetical protein
LRIYTHRYLLCRGVAVMIVARFLWRTAMIDVGFAALPA